MCDILFKILLILSVGKISTRDDLPSTSGILGASLTGLGGDTCRDGFSLICCGTRDSGDSIRVKGYAVRNEGFGLGVSTVRAVFSNGAR